MASFWQTRPLLKCGWLPLGCLCTPSPFIIVVCSKRKEFAPTNYFLLEKKTFQKGVKKILKDRLPLKVFPFTIILFPFHSFYLINN